MLQSRLSGALAAFMAVAAALAIAQGASAQDKCARTIDLNAAVSEYVEQHALEVGDVAGHQIRIFEIHRTYPTIEPNCEGLKQTETSSYGYSDYIGRSGHAWGYSIDTFENGDKIFSRFSGTSQTVVNADGMRRSTFSGTAMLTGGTGIYKGVRGSSRSTIVFDPEANLNVGTLELEYWLAD